MANETGKLAVAQTILSQLGGGRFLAMTGARQLVGSSDTLSFSIPTVRGINKVSVKLDANDTYTVKMMRVRGVEVDIKAEVGGVYCDRLQDVFTHYTGLFTAL